MPITTMCSKEDYDHAIAEGRGADYRLIADYSGHESNLVQHRPYTVVAGETDWDKPCSKRDAHDLSGVDCEECGAKPMGPLYMRTEYRGAVVETRERNGRDDSDFYAIVWDGAKLTEVTYASTRGWTYPNHAEVDATPEVLAAVDEWLVAFAYAAAKRDDEKRAATVDKGKRVRVVRGRKVEHGVEGVIFYWSEATYSPRFKNGYKQGPDAVKIGIALDDTRDARGRFVNVAWTYAANVEVVDPTQYATPDATLRKLAERARGNHTLPTAIAMRSAGWAFMR